MAINSGTRNRRGLRPTAKKAVDFHLVSDATCGLARHMLVSMLTQFSDLERNLRCHAFCDTEEKLHISLKGLRKRRALVFSALAGHALKATVAEICAAQRVPHFDLTGGCVEFIEQHTGLVATNDIAAIHRHDAAYFDRIEALEFSLQHDDSRRLESIEEAEIVLVGVSRVSKTPTSAYLGWLGYRVANVSIVPGRSVARELKRCRSKSVGLTMRPKTLAEIRSRRLALNGFQEKFPEGIAYTDMRTTIREVMQAEQTFKSLGIPTIDTTELTIEEIGTKVLEIVGSGSMRGPSKG